MCGRYAFISGGNLQKTYGLFREIQNAGQAFKGLPRFNASPMQRLPVIVARGGKITAEVMQWWLIPRWSRENKTRFSTFNARAETLATSKLYAQYYRENRCLVPADAFYEWKKITEKQPGSAKEGGRSGKQPMCVRMKDRTPFLMAGLFSVWKDATGNELGTFTIITTVPNTLMESIHNRMPVIIPEKHFEEWLDGDRKDTEELQKLLVPYTDGQMEAYPVSGAVNNPRNDSRECMTEIHS